MTPREIVLATLEYARPERVARSFRDSDFAHSHHSAKTHATPWREVEPGLLERTDEWGNTWRRIDATSKGEVARGVLDDLEGLDDLARYEFPDFSRPADYEKTRAARREHPDTWIIGGMPGFTFNVARKLRRLDQYLVDLLIEPAKIHALHDRVDVALEQMIANYAAAGADCIMFPEDWGTQDRLMIDPKLWREEFGPRFRKLCGLARECGVRVFMHSCGMTGAIIPDLMEAGVSVLQFDQPELHGLDALAAHQERGKITFWCPVDIQKTLQSKDEAGIRTAARALLDKLWRGRGGFIAGYYSDNASIGLDPAVQEIACEEFVRRGVAADYESSGP